MLAAIARPMSSLYFGGIWVFSSWYFFMSGQSCISVSLGMAVMKPGMMPRVFFMSFNVSSYSPIFGFTVFLLYLWIYKVVRLWGGIDSFSLDGFLVVKLLCATLYV